MYKLKYGAILLSVLLLFILVRIPIVNAQTFKDIPSSYAGYQSIEWAVSKEIIKGYNDGTYRKSETLTEAQFAAVLSRYFSIGIDKQPSKGHWSDKYYNFLSTHNLYLPGHQDKKKRFEPLPRAVLAELLAKSQQPEIQNERQAIQWLYDNQITKGFGKSPDAFVDFNPSGILERGQVASFFQRLYEKNFRSIVKEGQVVVNTIRGEDLSKIMHASWASQFDLQKRESVTAVTLRLPHDYGFRIDTYLGDQILSFNLFQNDLLSFEVVVNTIKTSYNLEDTSALLQQLQDAVLKEQSTVNFMDREISITYRTNPVGKVITISLYY